APQAPDFAQPWTAPDASRRATLPLHAPAHQCRADVLQQFRLALAKPRFAHSRSQPLRASLRFAPRSAQLDLAILAAAPEAGRDGPEPSNANPPHAGFRLRGD